MKILAGPLLRHANREQINIWFVLNERAADIRAQIVNAAQETLGESVMESHEPVQVGENAFVYLLQARPGPEGFPLDAIIYYDVKINGGGLADFGLLNGENGVAYEGEPLPGLVLKEEHRVILQGSCRKPHASAGDTSQRDMMTTADALIQERSRNIDERPSLLFLTGDQIYADDVAAPLLAKIMNLVQEYIVHDERIPRTAQGAVRVSSLKLDGRAQTLSGKKMGFTSTEKDNHLLSFGEFFLMYCAVWGGFDARCPEFSAVEDVIVGVDEDYGDAGGDGDDDDLEDLEEEYETSRSITEEFLQGAFRARRLMANVPTYMIFDDHEVSDDWNLDEGNFNAFRKHIFSRRVAANALTAYWLCQGWGNCPDEFPPEFKTVVREYLGSYSQDKFLPLERLLQNQYWGFELDTRPYTAVLDTRTAREFNENKFARLMSPAKLAAIAMRIRSLPDAKKQNNSLLLVSPSPVYGFSEVERIQLAAGEDSRRSRDSECWIADELIFKQLQSMLLESGFNECIIFSGDVHYGFCRHEILVNVQGARINVFQLTSSSLHNAPGTLGRIGLKVMEKKYAFEKSTGPYLCPENDPEYFINQAVNFGILELNKGRPTIFTLNSETPPGFPGDGEGFSWIYDLQNPRHIGE